MDTAVIVTLSIYLFIMLSICSASVLLKRGRTGRILESQFPPPSRQGGHNSLGVPSRAVFSFLPLHSAKLDEVAPELVYGDKHSFHKVRPQLRELFKYCKYMAPVQDSSICKDTDIENAISISSNSCSTSPNDAKLHLEDEQIIVEAQNPSHTMFENKGKNILERILFAVYLKGNDEEAEWLFNQVLRDHNICVICLEDFEVDCSIRMLHCAHFFHSNCLSQWLSKSTQCPLCKVCVYLENVEQTNIPNTHHTDSDDDQRRVYNTTSPNIQQEIWRNYLDMPLHVVR
ncbi:hypothetical protein GpartN1_g2657.t1 [Galdieria partita]|uniref:RING-type domain-containing protein n=1 Tax=Galdieria partita TaxID=83374 RepID=A0A9C7PUY4_9RHOD|nr:hypothetical protein GpartN1_g2657.t1 [Galdieria partita]